MRGLKSIGHQEDDTWEWQIYLYGPKNNSGISMARGKVECVRDYSTEKKAQEAMDKMWEDLELEKY